MTEAVSVELKCGRCGRAAGDDTFKCPRLARGDCAFERERLTNVGARLFGAGFALFAAFWLVLWINQQGPDLGLGDLIGVLVGYVFLAVGLWMVLNTKSRLHDPDSGLTLIRRTLFGFPVSLTALTRGTLLPLELDPGRPLPVPASVSQLQESNQFTMSQAIDVVRAAVMALLAEGLAQVYVAEDYRARFGAELAKTRNLYTLSATEKAETVRPNSDLQVISTPTGRTWVSQYGSLETRILDLLKAWDGRPEAREWPQGPSLYELIRGIYDKDVSSPAKWLVSIVTGEAERRGLGRKQGLLRRDFVLDEAYSDRVWAACEQVADWGTQLYREQQAFYGALGEETEKAINSRQKSDNDGPMW